MISSEKHDVSYATEKGPRSSLCYNQTQCRRGAVILDKLLKPFHWSVKNTLKSNSGKGWTFLQVHWVHRISSSEWSSLTIYICPVVLKGWLFQVHAFRSKPFMPLKLKTFLSVTFFSGMPVFIITAFHLNLRGVFVIAIKVGIYQSRCKYRFRINAVNSNAVPVNCYNWRF